MKKILLTITAFLVTLLAVAQSPNLLNYQGVARNSVGNVLPSQPIGLRLSILAGSPTGTPVYTETRNVTTNAFGLFNVQVGSPGAITTIGTIAGINWTAFGVGAGSKFLQVEIDPIGGTNYFNVGSTQLVSVPYSLYAGAAAPVGPAGGDLTGTYPNPQILFPLIKTFNFPTSQLIGMTNSSPTGILGAITGTSASNDANATAIMGTMSSTSPGGFSAGIRGVNNGTGGLGIGVYGSQAGSGWGVYGTTPNGWGVYGLSTTSTGVNGASTSGVGVAGTSNSNSSGVFTNGNAANTANTLVANTNGAGDAVQAINSGTGKAGSFTINNAANANIAVDANSNGTNTTVNAANTGTGAAGSFTVNNAASTADALRVVTNGVGASWAIRATSTGTNGAGLFISNNATATNNNLQSNTNGLGRAGLFNSTNAGSAANGVDINVAGTGYALRAASSNATPSALQTVGALQLTGIGEGAPNPPNSFKILAGTATGNATWQHASAIGLASGSGTLNFVPKWTPNTTTLGNSQIFDDGTNVGIGTTTPGQKLTVVDAGNSNQFNGTFSVFANNLTQGVGIGYAGIRALGSNPDQTLFFNARGTAPIIMQTVGTTGNVGIGTNTAQHKLSVGSTVADAQNVMVRGFGNDPLNWKGGGAFGNTNASVIMGELNSVAQIGGHTSNLGGWAPLSINSVPGNNVGIGTAAPAYALDVNHNGATGLHVRSLAAFSVIDLDAANGDAALRYQNAGTTRWNVRNAPGSNDYQIVRNNSLPANVTINNGTGYVGITQTAPTYQLDVLNTGGNGIRSQSSASFSVVDIDANNGDAALRFYKAGAGQWNMRNRPSDDNLEIFELGGGGSRMVIQNTTGNVGINQSTPISTLDVNGSITMTDGFQGTSRLMFDNGAGVGTARWTTPAAAGLVTGTGVATRVAFWNSASNLSSNANLYWDDASSRLGVGTAAPSYPLDVVHGGATGLHVASTASFSVVDIDANSGDAALRFQKSGVGQWNTRNRPADDYYEIFELGGGGSRLVIQDATGNVGIGATVSPSYKLDVEHGGATGIRSRSTGSFSVVDIDAASGDAALRFQAAGVNQWNMRNRPGDNYLEIFELGGGGSRMAIQDGTGNVGIGNTSASIAYRLDVQHGGATGIRSQSTASFSVVDIDAASGDAALRFQKAGVNQWNIRNRPADDYLEIFELGGGGSRMVIQDGTGNVGIGATVAPAYKLDVEHGGATGIRSRSTGTFSVVDIDAANGDAALRFAAAGVNQWNTRNRPADNYYEIFELGGGGSRMVIQDGSGNVGIGQTINPSYKLDVLHGGATGLRVQSSATFSVIDIDGQNGDAALRFARAGVNQWNTRNNPATDDYQIFELGGGGERMRIENTTGAVVVNGNFTALGIKAFTMDHPLDPSNKTLMHAAVESNEVLNSYSGNVVTDASGKATISLPEYFEAINKDFRYQLTVVGGTFAQAMVSKEISNNKFEIATNQPNVKVSWEVKGVRNDARMKMNPFTAVQEKSGAQKGKYIDPKSHNQPESKGVSYDANLNSSLSDIKPAADKKAAPATTGGSLEQGPITKPSTAKMDNSGSLSDVAPAKTAAKKADVSGSVVDMPAAKATDKKLAIDGSLLEVVPVKPTAKPVAPKVDNSKMETPAAKPAPQKVDNSGSVAPDTKKQEVKSVAPKSTEPSSLNGN